MPAKEIDGLLELQSPESLDALIDKRHVPLFKKGKLLPGKSR